MINRNEILLSLFSGAIAGALVLGIVGRFAMAVVSFLLGSTVNLSLSGIFEALVIGTIFGLIGGLLHLCVVRIVFFSRSVQGIILGMILFVLSLLISVQFTKMKFSFNSTQYFTLTTIFVIYIAYGISINPLMAWLKQIQKNKLFRT